MIDTTYYIIQIIYKGGRVVETLNNIVLTIQHYLADKRIAQRYDLSERKAADKIKRIDRERKSYYEFHTGSDWGSIGAHQMLLNVSKLGVEGTVDVLEAICRRKMKE